MENEYRHDRLSYLARLARAEANVKQRPSYAADALPFIACLTLMSAVIWMWVLNLTPMAGHGGRAIELAFIVTTYLWLMNRVAAEINNRLHDRVHRKGYSSSSAVGKASLFWFAGLAIGYVGIRYAFELPDWDTATKVAAGLHLVALATTHLNPLKYISYEQPPNRELEDYLLANTEIR